MSPRGNPKTSARVWRSTGSLENRRKVAACAIRAPPRDLQACANSTRMRGWRSSCCLTRPRTARRRACALCPRTLSGYWRRRRLVALLAHSLRQQTLRRRVAERNLDGGRSASRRRALVIHVDAAAEIRTVRDADTRREDVAFHFRRSADRHRFAGEDVAIDAALYDHELGADVAGHAAILADRQAARVFDRTFQLALEFQVLFAVQLALEMQRRAEHAGAGCHFLLRRRRRGRHLVLEAFAHGFLRLSGLRRGWRILATQHSIPW